MAIIVGKILDKTRIDSFQFVTTEYFNLKFVEVEADHISKGTKIVGEITEKEVVNPFFERPSDIRYINKVDETVKDRSLYIAKVKSLAMIQNGEKVEVTFPPLPGSNVFEASEDHIKLCLGLKNEGLDIGDIKGYNLPFKAQLDKTFRTHISILGQTGSGKSYLAAKLAIELLKLRHYSDIPSQIPIPIIFDSSGEYSGDYDLSGHRELASIMDTRNIIEHHLPLLHEKYLPLLYDIYDIDEKQESDLRLWFSPSENKREEKLQPQLFKRSDVKDLVEGFKKIKINSTKQLADNLERYIKDFNKLDKLNEKLSIPYKSISKMRKFNLKIKKTDDLDIKDQLSNGLIVNLSEQDNYAERQIVMLLFLRQLYEIKKAKKLTSKIVLFIDEAHNYVPSIYKSFCKDEILKLAREGRKYGITLCLISQRPRWVDPTALSQCGNVFIFRIQNSDDKKHIFDSASLPDTLKDINIAKFRTGEMIVTGDIVNYPMHCQVSQLDSNFISMIDKKERASIRKKSQLDNKLRN